MGEFFEDRRQEPRFSTVGRYRLQISNGEIEGRILDLSLNGAQLEREDAASLKPGEKLGVSLEFEGHEPFAADVLVIRTDGVHLGVEFYDMTPEHFSALSDLIDSLTRAQHEIDKRTHA